MAKSRLSMEERFWSFVDRPDPLNCWVWMGKDCLPGGYGRFSVSGSGSKGTRRRELAHRFSWSLVHGDIPINLEILHRCDNPPCVNPAHLFLGTQSENIRDAVRKGRMPHGVNHHNAKLTPDLVRLIRASRDNNCAIGRQIGVNHSTIRNVRLGKIWRHV